MQIFIYITRDRDRVKVAYRNKQIESGHCCKKVKKPKLNISKALLACN